MCKPTDPRNPANRFPRGVDAGVVDAVRLAHVVEQVRNEQGVIVLEIWSSFPVALVACGSRVALQAVRIDGNHVRID